MKRSLKIRIIVALIFSMAMIFGLLSPLNAAEQKTIILATTTCTQDTGLLDVLIPMFEKKTGYFVKTIAVGSGQAMAMGQTLNVAAENKGYTLTDRGTYLALKKTLGLDILNEGDAILLNIYHVIEVNPAKWPKVNVAGGKAFADFMVSRETQDVIGTFGTDKFGAPLFFPDGGKKVEELGK